MSYPNVPPLPGVPPLLRELGAASGSISASIAKPLAVGAQPAPIWGVFDAQNQPVAVADSFVGFRFKGSAQTSNYPLERGSFSTYNKVQLPDISDVLFSCGGDSAKRAAFIAALDAAKKSLNLYSIVTPDATYLSCSIDNVDYRRENNDGAYFVIASLSLTEVRITTPAYTNSTKTAAGASPASGGRVQAAAPSPKITSVLGSAVEFVQGLN